MKNEQVLLAYMECSFVPCRAAVAFFVAFHLLITLH